MPKRKRSSTSPTQSNVSNTAARQKKLCIQRLTTALKPLLAALRLGAGFERQKHSRRKKTAQSKNDAKALERLEVEYAVLKGLDLEKVADQHLRRTIVKVKSLKDAEALQEYVNGSGGAEEKGYEGRALAKDPATLNVTARLYKVPAVKKVIDEVIADLKGIIGAGEGAETAPYVKNEATKMQRKSKTQQKEDEDMPDASDEADDPYMAFSARIAAPSSGEDDSEESVSDNERPPSIGDSESEHDPDDDLEAVSDEDEGDEFDGASSDEEDNELEPAYKKHFHSVASASDLSSTDGDAESESENESLIAPSKSKAKHAKDAKVITSSAFIPALSHAAYFSGSESEASDLDTDIAPRKNRRGQRARQKIAEAKFGAKAKHLEKAGRNQGWDAKRGAVGDDRRGRGSRGGVPGGRGPQQSGGNAEPLGKKSGGVKRDDKGELHPSWQAAKAAKESKKLKIDIKGGEAPGRKVVFD